MINICVEHDVPVCGIIMKNDIFLMKINVVAVYYFDVFLWKRSFFFAAKTNLSGCEKRCFPAVAAAIGGPVGDMEKEKIAIDHMMLLSATYGK